VTRGDDLLVNGSSAQVRHCTFDDAHAVCELAGQLAQSFPFSRARFHDSFAALLTGGDACVLLATVDGDNVGYLLGFSHLTFYANGPVAWVEEVLVRPDVRGRGVGRELMHVFERWAIERDCVLSALATRRAGPFYLALGYQESATYLRKILP
jgi:GNAT superfamily N-acetyltransferase